MQDKYSTIINMDRWRSAKALQNPTDRPRWHDMFPFAANSAGHVAGVAEMLCYRGQSGRSRSMASDRGTLSRSAGLSGDQQAPWAEPSGPSGRRMPSAPRERKPALFALAILLVALGAGAAGLLVIRAGTKVQA